MSRLLEKPFDLQDLNEAVHLALAETEAAQLGDVFEGETTGLLATETRAQTVLIDFALAGSDMGAWVDQIRAIRPEATVIGTGGIGAESDQGACASAGLLRAKPPRITDRTMYQAG